MAQTGSEEGGRGMTYYTYSVKIGGIALAQHMALDDATLFVQALFNRYKNEEKFTISIEREAAEE